MKKQTSILTIAGFDPSGGAGILADIKTFQAFKCQGMAVQTANTLQTADKFEEVKWEDEAVVTRQLTLLLQTYEFSAVKIGLIPSFQALENWLSILKALHKKVPVIWDPVLSASAGFKFHKNMNDLSKVLSAVDWVTPNWNEVKILGRVSEALEAAKQLAAHTNVYLKGGHQLEKPGKDFWVSADQIRGFNPKLGNYSEKHGSGCAFSAALAANLGKGYPPQKAILNSKRMIERLLKSSTTKLAVYHG